MRALVVAAAVLIAACGNEPEPPPEDTGVRRDSGQPKDAEPTDVGEEPDVGVDAGFPDMGFPDSGVEPMDATPIDMGPVDAGYGCDELPQPVWTEVAGTAYHDITFDADGDLVGSDGSSIWKSKFDGTRMIFVPNQAAWGGIKYLPSGDLAIAGDFSTGSGVTIVHPNAGRETIGTNIAGAFGLAIDLMGRIWIANHDDITRLDPVTGTSTIVLNSGEVPSPRSITFDADYQTLFVGSTQSAMIYAVPLDADGNPTFPQIWGSLPVGAGWVDGMGTDECGNLYVADYLTQSLYKVPPTGVGELVFAWPSGKYGHGLEFGSGLGGWDEYSIYLPQPYDNNTVVQVWLGVRGKPRPFP